MHRLLFTGTFGINLEKEKDRIYFKFSHTKKPSLPLYLNSPELVKSCGFFKESLHNFNRHILFNLF